jgi:hypothetical protein
MLKKLFYASASILMLAIAYHMGAHSAHADATRVSAQSFVLNDAQGHMRGHLYTDENGVPALELIHPKGPSVYLGFATDVGGSPMFSFRAATDSLLMGLISHPGGTDLELCDLSGKPRATLTAGSSAWTGLRLRDDNGNVRTSLGGSYIGASTLVLTDEHGNVVFQAPTDVYGRPVQRH